MAGFLVVPDANADDDLTGAVFDTIATTPQTITGLANGTAYVAYRVSDASGTFTPTGSSFSEASIGNAGVTSQLDKFTAFANTADAKTRIMFASVTIPTTWTGTVRPIKAGYAEDGIRINADGAMLTRARSTADALIATCSTSTGVVSAGDRLNVLVTWDTDVGVRLAYKIGAGSWVSSTFVSVTSGVLIDNTLTYGDAEIPKNVTEDFDAVHRVAAWLNGETVPDITSASVQNNFVNSDGTLVDPATSRTAYGTPAIDLYEAAATWNASSGNNSGNGGDFTAGGSSPGTFTDV